MHDMMVEYVKGVNVLEVKEYVICVKEYVMEIPTCPHLEVQKHQSSVLIGETGSGKTTQAPQKGAPKAALRFLPFWRC